MLWLPFYTAIKFLGRVAPRIHNYKHVQSSFLYNIYLLHLTSFLYWICLFNYPSFLLGCLAGWLNAKGTKLAPTLFSLHAKVWSPGLTPPQLVTCAWSGWAFSALKHFSFVWPSQTSPQINLFFSNALWLSFSLMYYSNILVVISKFWHISCLVMNMYINM